MPPLSIVLSALFLLTLTQKRLSPPLSTTAMLQVTRSYNLDPRPSPLSEMILALEQTVQDKGFFVMEPRLATALPLVPLILFNDCQEHYADLSPTMPQAFGQPFFP